MDRPQRARRLARYLSAGGPSTIFAGFAQPVTVVHGLLRVFQKNRIPSRSGPDALIGPSTLDQQWISDTSWLLLILGLVCASPAAWSTDLSEPCVCIHPGSSRRLCWWLKPRKRTLLLTTSFSRCTYVLKGSTPLASRAMV